MFQLSGQPHSVKPRILFLVPSDYDALARKGVARMILERDENGFFERVVTVHPIALQDRVIDLDPIHRIHEFSAGRAFESGFAARIALLWLPIRMVAIAWRIRRITEEEGIDIIRATDAYLMGVLAWIVARATGRRFCVSLHADYDKRFALSPKTGARRLIRSVAGCLPGFVLPRAHMVLPIRNHLAEWAERKGVSRDRIRLIPHGIDLEPFEHPVALDVRSLLSIAPSVSIVSFVGRLTMDNYVDHILDAAARLAGRRSGFVFVLAGEGDEAARIRSLIAASPALTKCVQMVGFQPYDRVVALRRASAVALCLMGGFSLVEACAAACPVVTYDVEWHRDLVVDGVNGFVVQEGDIDRVVGAIDRLLSNAAGEAVQMGERGRALAFAQHDLRATTEIKRGCYQLLMASAAQ